MEQPPQSSSTLQFDTATSRADEPGATGVTCVACRRTIVTDYFDVSGHLVCETCRDGFADHAKTPTGLAVLIRAGVLGLLAAVLGAILYFSAIAFLKLGIGILAIAIGYMVGYAVRLGTRGRGGRRFQVMAILLTYWSVGLAYTGVAVKGAQEATTRRVAPASASDVTVTVSGKPEAGPRAAATPPRSLLPVLIVGLGFTFVLPTLVVFASFPSGLISALIIGFGMRQAWMMTAAPALQISGPYKIAGNAVSSPLVP